MPIIDFDNDHEHFRSLRTNELGLQTPGEVVRIPNCNVSLIPRTTNLCDSCVGFTPLSMQVRVVGDVFVPQRSVSRSAVEVQAADAIPPNTFVRGQQVTTTRSWTEPVGIDDINSTEGIAVNAYDNCQWRGIRSTFYIWNWHDSDDSGGIGDHGGVGQNLPGFVNYNSLPGEWIEYTADSNDFDYQLGLFNPQPTLNVGPWNGSANPFVQPLTHWITTTGRAGCWWNLTAGGGVITASLFMLGIKSFEYETLIQDARFAADGTTLYHKRVGYTPYYSNNTSDTLANWPLTGETFLEQPTFQTVAPFAQFGTTYMLESPIFTGGNVANYTGGFDCATLKQGVPQVLNLITPDFAASAIRTDFGMTTVPPAIEISI